MCATLPQDVHKCTSGPTSQSQEQGSLLTGRLCMSSQVEGALYPDMKASWVDGFYFAVATLTTVGYGDMGPQTTASRAFALFYALACGAVTAAPTEGSRGLGDLWPTVLAWIGHRE